MRTTGPVADSFLARLDAEEASRLSPLAVRSSQASYVTGAAWSADGGTVPIIL